LTNAEVYAAREKIVKAVKTQLQAAVSE